MKTAKEKALFELVQDIYTLGVKSGRVWWIRDSRAKYEMQAIAKAADIVKIVEKCMEIIKNENG